MQLKTIGNIVEIKGTIANVTDFELIKREIEQIKGDKNIVLRILDSLVINSSLIGYLIKLINHENVSVHIQAAHPTLIELLEDIGLDKTFQLQKITV